eukprot:365303-Chlamydomonas_euryale.AAC.43
MYAESDKNTPDGKLCARWHPGLMTLACRQAFRASSTVCKISLAYKLDCSHCEDQVRVKLAIGAIKIQRTFELFVLNWCSHLHYVSMNPADHAGIPGRSFFVPFRYNNPQDSVSTLEFFNSSATFSQWKVETYLDSTVAQQVRMPVL